jgi:hypothetical protein
MCGVDAYIEPTRKTGPYRARSKRTHPIHPYRYCSHIPSTPTMKIGEAKLRRYRSTLLYSPRHASKLDRSAWSNTMMYACAQCST